MGDKKGIGKGDRVKVTSGRSEGVTGTVFWMGQNKYGPGDRFGVRGDDGQTHWVDGTEVEPTDAAVPEGPEFSRGDRVRFKHEGQEGIGTVFWTGKSRHGPGQRLGVNPDGAEGRDDAVWLDSLAARPLDPADDPGAPPPPGNPYGGGRGGPGRGSADSGHDNGVAEIPAEYSSSISIDELPPAAPLDDAAVDQMAAWSEDEDDGPPLDW